MGRLGGGSKAALHFRKHNHNKNEQEGSSIAEAPEEMEASRYRLEEGDDSTHAQRIVRELYVRYQKQLQRWRDYRNLFVFLGFVSLFLAVLYLQRQANTAYKVHATLEDVLVPNDKVMQDTDTVYTWLDGILREVWKDPKCGDGLCESPFEFASYSRFGCRADCGKLQDIQKLTKIQIDVYYDFSHPIGSIPASDLMQQASWNLCPKQTSYSGDCYYDDDVKFDRLSGSMSMTIEDAPDGDWDLIVRRDIFNKVRGAVRDTTKLYAVSYYYKIYVAAMSALAEQNMEVDLLQQAIRLGTQPYWTYVSNTLRAARRWNAANFTNVGTFDLPNLVSLPNNTLLQADFEFQQLLNATCGCSFEPTSSSPSAPLWGANALLALNNSADLYDSSQTFSTDISTYRAKYCLDPALGAPLIGGAAKPQYWEVNAANRSANGTLYRGAVPLGVTNFTTIHILELSNNATSWCNRVLNNSIIWRQNFTQTVQRLMIDRRLGDSRTTGKISARNTVYNNLRNNIILQWPELFDPVFSAPKGSVGIPPDTITARVDVLQELFVSGPFFSTRPQPASLGIIRRTIYNPNVTMLDMVARAQSRINETQFQQNDTLTNLLLPPPMDNGTYVNMTVDVILQAFWAANATNATIPDANSTRMAPTIRTDYNLVKWDGNTTAYMVCELPDRGTEYLGKCMPMNNTCVVTNIDTAPYSCTLLGSDGLSTGVTVVGNLSNIDYRQNCEIPCDRLLDCNTLCECYGECGSSQFCECDACVALNVNAARDSQFLDIRSVAEQAGQSTAAIADISGGFANRRRGRYLMQNADMTTQLTQVLSQVGLVKTQQDTIASQMTRLQAQVDRANSLAEARANDNRLIDLIQAGRQDISAGQQRVEAKLDEIIGKQNASLAAAEEATKALSAIQGLAQKQLAAQQALEKAVQNQLTAIKTATFQNIISLTQALALWKRARRDRALTLKAAKLANVPCNAVPTADNDFKLDNGNVVDNTTARERNIGLTNRVISGMLLHQYRTNDTNCTESKFSKIQQTCTGPITLKSFGVDPVFKRGTTLYDSDKDDLDGQIVLQYYNCSVLSNPTYNITFQNTTTNQAPYCAELYNSQRLPYAFHHFPLRDKPAGFPVFFDINLSEDGADTWSTYLSEGLYLDQHTRSLTAEVVTYNAPLRIFGYFFVEFFFSDGGSIKVTHRLHTVRVELYNSSEDSGRFALEIILSGWITIMLLHTLWQIAMCQKEKKNFLKFFASGWNWVDFISNCLLFSCMVIWWVFVNNYAKIFDIQLRHNAYQGLQPDANFLALNDRGSEMVAHWEEVHDLRDLIDMLNWYFALNGINILLLIARVLKLMDFQPRLGVVTRSLWLAGPDLIHFAIVAGMVFVGYAMMAHLIFGNAIEKFATFGDSVNTCFEILLGNIDVNEDLRALGGLQSVAGALFFWSYELLVFMVLLNFLLAIIVDAFSEVKEKTHETVGIHTELYQLMRDKWRSLMGSCSSNYISDAKLGQLLKQWAGQEEEEENKKEASEVQKLLTILNEDLDEDDLRNVLMECLKDAPAHEEDEKSTKRTGLLARCLPGQRRVVASPHEVAQAAKYIVDRFGVPIEAEEEPFGDAPEPLAADEQGGPVGGIKEAALEKERDQLAAALERLAEVQRELADGQRNLMIGQKQLAEQQGKLVTLMNTDGSG